MQSKAIYYWKLHVIGGSSGSFHYIVIGTTSCGGDIMVFENHCVMFLYKKGVLYTKFLVLVSVSS